MPVNSTAKSAWGIKAYGGDLQVGVNDGHVRRQYRIALAYVVGDTFERWCGIELLAGMRLDVEIAVVTSSQKLDSPKDPIDYPVE